jgi:expansin
MLSSLSSFLTIPTPSLATPPVPKVSTFSLATPSVSLSYTPAVAAAAAPTSAGTTTGLDASTHSGQATYYGGNVSGGMCSFSTYKLPSSLFGTALSDSNWANAQLCGACVKVSSGGKTVTAMIVDQCPGCGSNHLDLFPDAFSSLANPSAGIIDVSWTLTPCGITSPIVLKNKSGTSKFWFSMQVMNANVPVKTLEVSTDGGKSWKGTTRQDYNYFENASGFGVDSVTVRVTSVTGESTVVQNVGTTSEASFTGPGNFS